MMMMRKFQTLQAITCRMHTQQADWEMTNIKMLNQVEKREKKREIRRRGENERGKVRLEGEREFFIFIISRSFVVKGKNYHHKNKAHGRLCVVSWSNDYE